MTIIYDGIPARLYTPGSYIEFNNELASATSQSFKALMFGMRLNTGTVAANTPVRVTDPSQGVTFFGRGSMLAAMISATLKANPSTELWVIAQDEATAGTAATASLTIDSAATSAGTLVCYLGGKAVRIGVAENDTQAVIAANLVTAITLDKDVLVNAAIDGTTAHQINLTAKHKGEVFNGFDVRFNYYGEAMPEGVTVTTVNLSGGTANPDIASSIAAMGDAWFNWLTMPYTDTANLTALKAELDSRWSPMRQIDCRAFAAFAGTHAATGTFGGNHNSPHLSVMGISTSPTPTFIASAINTAVASFNLSIDPARPLQTLVLPGFKAPALQDRYTQQERNLLLFDGISTFTVGDDGTCRIERQITTYQTNAAGLPDASYLDVNTPETLSRIRFEQRSMIAQQYPRHKLADDGTNYGAGQPIVTPKIIKGQLLALYRDLETRGWVEDYDNYAALMIVERDATDRNRLNWRDTPNLVNQARVFAGKQQFIV